MTESVRAVCRNIIFMWVLFALTGCSFFLSTKEIILHLPQLPESYEVISSDSVALLVVDEEGRSYSAVCPQGSTVDIAVEQSRMFIVLARYGSEIPCAGAVLPWDGENEAELTFFKGYCGELLLDLQNADGSPYLVNYSRMLEQTVEVSQGNPGRLDRRRILSALMLGNLLSRDIVLLPEYVLPQETLPDGNWFPVEPLGQEVSNGEWGTFRQGRTLYFNGEYTLTVCCDSLGWSVYSVPACYYSTGYW